MGEFVSPPESRELVIACGSDEAYAVHMLVMLQTLVKAHPGDTSFRVYVMDGGIRPETKARFDRLLAREKRVSWEWLSINFDDLSGLMPNSWIPHLSSATLMRLLLPDLLPTDVEKLLYIDSDVVVEKDVVPFYETPFVGKHVVGVQDFNQPTLAYVSAKDPSVPASAPTFNAGIILINLARFRETGYMKKVIEIMRGQPTWSDQEGLNAVLVDEWVPASLVYNLQSSWITPGFIPDSSLKEDVMRLGVERMRDGAVMLHFTGNNKPWAGRWNHPYRSRYEALLKESGWFTSAEWRAWKLRRLGGAVSFWLEHRFRRA